MKYAKVTWQVQASKTDTGYDSDLYPDRSQVQGYVRFVPETWVHKPTGSWAVVETRFAEITGDRLTHQGADGIYLEATVDPLAVKPTWYWTVEFDLYHDGQPLSLPPKRFALEADTEVDLAQILSGTVEAGTSRARLGMAWADPQDAPPPETFDGLLWLKTNGDILYFKEQQ